MNRCLNLKKANLFWMLLAIIAFSHEVLAGQYGDLRGVFKGKSFTMKTVTITRKVETGTMVLEFFENEFPDSDICKNKRAKSLLVEIPLSVRNGLSNQIDYEDSIFKLVGQDGSVTAVNGYSDLKLKNDDLNSPRSAFVNGSLEFVSLKTKTEVSGTFTARVCNLEQSI